MNPNAFRQMMAETGKLTHMNEETPSRAQYFSWINNTNEGSTEAQTLANLDFFKWLHDEYGMQLEIYAWDAGNIDGASCYGTMESYKFRQQYPHGFQPIVDKAASFGCRIGIWGGPDGFGSTPQEEQARIDMMVKLCKEYHFVLFKFDGVCGGLRPEKQDAFVKMMQECRKYSPDLILLNHRLDLGKGFPYATTYLMGGQETYIDVFMTNSECAPHHRGQALKRAAPSNLRRLTEDHGVCISSCVDFWEDDLILQAFNRCMILAPETYGSPWFLPDEDYPRFARIYNLHRKYREIMVHGMHLPEAQYGPNAIARGSATTRIITLRNISWESKKYTILLNESIGLQKNDKQSIHVRRFHPLEQIMGQFHFGDSVEVEIPSYRSALYLITYDQTDELGIIGCEYEVNRDVKNNPAKIYLLGLPGTTAQIQLELGNHQFHKAIVGGKEKNELLTKNTVSIEFKGTKLTQQWHRKLSQLTPISVPKNAEALYEATCFAADNNALEFRELQKVGKSTISQVQNARDYFVNQPILVQRGVWDQFAFDGKMDTFFKAQEKLKVRGGALRIDCGEAVRLDRLVIHGNNLFLDSKTSLNTKIHVQCSTDLNSWENCPITLTTALYVDCPSYPIRYFRIINIVNEIAEIEGYYQDKMVDRSKWRASNLFANYSKMPVKRGYYAKFILEEIPKYSYLAVPIYGFHGKEGAYVTFTIDGQLIGCPDRSPSYLSNVWEYYNAQVFKGYTYYLPLSENMVKKTIEVFVLDFRKGLQKKLKPEVWITTRHAPYEKQELILSN